VFGDVDWKAVDSTDTALLLIVGIVVTAGVFA